MKSFLYSLNMLPEATQKFLYDKYELDQNLFHYVIFDTSKAENIEEFEDYIQKNGFSDDVKIRMLANCYPIANSQDIRDINTTNNVTLTF